MKIIDMHCDTISLLCEREKKGKHYCLRENPLHIDLLKMKQSGYLVQNFAMFVCMGSVNDPLVEGLTLIDRFYEEIKKNEDLIAFAGSYNDIIKNEREGKMSALLTLEEGAIIKGSLPILRDLYRLGARMMTLTWNYENELASPNTNLSVNNKPDSTVPFTKWGLTKKGFEIIEEIEALGMILDVSHLSDAGFYDVLKVAKRPFVASHSNSRAICNHVRNLTDDMIKQLANLGGVMGINFCPYFLSDAKDYEGMICDIVKHIKHIEQIGGIDCIGLGSDFDGIMGHKELPDAASMPLLYNALQKEGFSDDKIDKIFYQNVLNLYKEILK